MTARTIDFRNIAEVYYGSQRIFELYSGDRLAWYFWQTPTNSPASLFDPTNQRIGRLDHTIGNPWGPTKLGAYAEDGWMTINPIIVKPNIEYSFNDIPEWILLYDSNLVATRLLAKNQTIKTQPNEFYLGAYTVSSSKKLDGFIVSQVTPSTPIVYVVIRGDSWYKIWDKNKETCPTLEQLYQWNDATADTPLFPNDQVIVGYT